MYCRNNYYIQILFENFYYSKILKLHLLFVCVCVVRKQLWRVGSLLQPLRIEFKL